MDTNQEREHNVQRQLAIMDVAARAEGASSREIATMLREAMERRRVPSPVGTWLDAVVRDASMGIPYVISPEVMAEARRRKLHSRPDNAAEAAPGSPGPQGRFNPPVREVAIAEPVPGRSEGLRGFLAVPVGEGPWPAVVMIHEAFAIDDVMLRQVQRMASAGYLVLMPDLFSAGGPRRCLSATFRALRAGQGRAFADIEAARQTLLERGDCTGAVGVLGFCMGGGFALASASKGFEAASVNYGMIPKDVADVLKGACPVVGSYGAKDRILARSVPRLEQALDIRSIDHDMKLYPSAGHGFLNDAPSGPALLQPLLKLVMGAGPDPEAAADAWQRIEAFFLRHLTPEPRRQG